MEAKEFYYLNFLNKNCPIDEEWKYEKPVYTIRVNKDAEDKVSAWLEKIVGCSFFYECDDEEILNIKITDSTLEPKLEEILNKSSEEVKDPIKINRYELVKGVKNQEDEKYYYIIDKVTLIVDRGRPRGMKYYGEGVIFVAATDSEWVNYNLAWEILQMLNREEVYTDMIDYCLEKKK